MAALLLLLGLLLAQEPSRPPLPENLPRRGEANILRPSNPALEERVQFVYWPGDEERAARLLSALERAPNLPGLPPDVPVGATFYLAPDAEIWDALTGGQVPSWGAGVAIPDEGIAVIPLNDGPLSSLAARDRTALHEWAHLGLHDYLGGLRIPRWFDEGYAQWASDGWNVEEAWRLRVALARGSTPPLDSLALTWPVDRVGADLAYLLSASAVQYLVEGSGVRGIEIFLSRWRDLGDFEEAFRRTFGFTTGGYELLWAEEVKRRYGWVLVLYRTAPFWFLGGIGLLLLFGRRRTRDRERLAGLRANDPPDQPAYWSPEVDRPPEGG